MVSRYKTLGHPWQPEVPGALRFMPAYRNHAGSTSARQAMRRDLVILSILILISDLFFDWKTADVSALACTLAL